MSATASPPSSVESLFQDAKTQFDTVKASFNSTWSNTQSALEFLASIIHRQTLRIQSLEAHTTELESTLADKVKVVESLEKKASDAKGSYESQIVQKQMQLAEAETRNAAMMDAANRGNSKLADLRQKADLNERLYKQSLALVTTLQQQLAQTGERKDGARRIQGEIAPEEKREIIEAALKKELETRSDAVRQAAAAVAKEALEANNALQVRVSSLEEQLRTSRSVVDNLTKAQQHWGIKPSPDTSTQRASPTSGASHRIIAGTYRPKPPPQNSTSSPLSLDMPVPDSRTAGSSSSTGRSSAPGPRSLRIDTSANSPETSTRDTIDLTMSPVGSRSQSRDGTPSAKRPRVESEALIPLSSSPHPDDLDINPQRPTQDLPPVKPGTLAGNNRELL